MSASDGVVVREQAEIATVEAVGLLRKNEDVARPERAAAAPDGQRATDSVAVGRDRVRPGVDQNEPSPTADMVAAAGGNRLQQQGASRKVGARVRKLGDDRR